MLLAGELQQVDERHYKFIGKEVILHSLQDLACVYTRLVLISKGYVLSYPGSFVWELGSVRVREHLESAEGMALRLPARIEKLQNKNRRTA